MQPTPPPPGKKSGFYLPLAFNAALVLVIAGWAYASNPQRNEALLVLALGVVALAGGNFLALLIAAIAGRSDWVTGFAVSVALLFIIGLGTCGLMGAG